MAVDADSWLHLSEQTPIRDGEIVGHGVAEQARVAIEKMLQIVEDAGYAPDAPTSQQSRTKRMSSSGRG